MSLICLDNSIVDLIIVLSKLTCFRQVPKQTSHLNYSGAPKHNKVRTERT